MRSWLFLAVDFVLSRDLELRATASWMESMDRPASLSLSFMGAHFNRHSWLRRSGQRRLEIQHRFQTEAIFIYFFSLTLSFCLFPFRTYIRTTRVVLDFVSSRTFYFFS